MLGTHPAPQVVARIGGLVGDVFHVGGVGIDAVAAQVLPQRVEELRGTLGHQRVQGVELGLPPFDRTGLAGEKAFPMPGDERPKISDCHGASCGYLSIRVSLPFPGLRDERKTRPA
jgi:hypothetical protein